MHSARIRLLMRTRGAKNTKSGAFLSIGLIMNFLSLNEILRISDQGKPIFGVNLKIKRKAINNISSNQGHFVSFQGVVGTT